MTPNDILGIGKVLPIDKLLDIMSKAVGRITKPYFDKKDVNTKAYEIRKLAEARADEMKILANAVKENFQLTGGIEYKEGGIAISSPKEIPQDIKQTILVEPPLDQRAHQRLDFQEAKKQLNIENITSYAAEELKNEKEVTDEPLDEDWTTRFFRIAEDISNEEMQALWGRILAGEIKQPKSYSLRTLELLKNLNKREAECFLKFGRLAVNSGGVSFIINFKGEKLLEEKYKLNFGERLLLEELGLITANDLQFKLGPTNDNHHQSVFIIGNVCVIAERPKGTPEQAIPVLVFTKIGQELLQLIEVTPELDYIQLLASKIRRPGITIKYATITEVKDEMVSFNGLADVPLTEQEQKQEEDRLKREEEKKQKEAEIQVNKK